VSQPFPAAIFMSVAMNTNAFTPDQTNYLDGFAAGSGLGRSLKVLQGGATFTATLGITEERKRPGEETSLADFGRAAQDRDLDAGKKLTPEEMAKRKLNGLDTWDMVLEHARDARFPSGTDVFMIKFQGMFYVAPAQDSFMCRLRIPAGIMSTHQMRGIATLAQDFGGGFADVTTRANLQIRQIGPKHTVDVLTGLHDLGIINRGAGADNIRNVTASPTAGIDPQELIDTRRLARQMHHYILNHREMYGLPRKFNIAFDGGGKISALEDTNDIGFTAVRVAMGNESVAPGIYFRLTLGGITGHKDFARDTGILLTESECVPVAAAIVKAFIEHGDRTDRRQSRLKYVLDRMGFDGFIKEVEKHLPKGIALRRFLLDHCDARPTFDAQGHIGFHPQKQAGLSYVGVVLPVGRMTCDQMRIVCTIADLYGSGTIRLTVWQNLLISDIRDENTDAVRQALLDAGLHYSASSVRAGLVACTGSAGCKFAASDTKKHAMMVAQYVESKLLLDVPVNIHLTGCHNSCAQHFIGDIGMIGTKIGEEAIEGYHVFVGGGYGSNQAIGRELFNDVAATELPRTIEQILRGYLSSRQDSSEFFSQFVRRNTIEALREIFSSQAMEA